MAASQMSDEVTNLLFPFKLLNPFYGSICQANGIVLLPLLPCVLTALEFTGNNFTTTFFSITLKQLRPPQGSELFSYLWRYVPLLNAIDAQGAEEQGFDNW